MNEQKIYKFQLLYLVLSTSDKTCASTLSKKKEYSVAKFDLSPQNLKQCKRRKLHLGPTSSWILLLLLCRMADL